MFNADARVAEWKVARIDTLDAKKRCDACRLSRHADWAITFNKDVDPIHVGATCANRIRLALRLLDGIAIDRDVIHATLAA